jgi:hypothetical protein
MPGNAWQRACPDGQRLFWVSDFFQRKAKDAWRRHTKSISNGRVCASPGLCWESLEATHGTFRWNGCNLSQKMFPTNKECQRIVAVGMECMSLRWGKLFGEEKRSDRQSDRKKTNRGKKWKKILKYL